LDYAHTTGYQPGTWYDVTLLDISAKALLRRRMADAAGIPAHFGLWRAIAARLSGFSTTIYIGSTSKYAEYEIVISELQ
jgi:hypothetical protein